MRRPPPGPTARSRACWLYGRRLQLDDGYTDSYDVPAGTHSFEWRYESKIGSGAGLLFPPYHRAWIDNVILINGAP